MPTLLHQGSFGAEVSKLQTLLNNRRNSGLPLLTTDGRFGPKTLARVREFQKASHLPPDGIVGPSTWAALAGPGWSGAGEMESPPHVADGTGLPENDGFALQFLQAFNDAAATPSESTPWSSKQKIGGPLPNGVRNVPAPLRIAASEVFGGSIDYSTVYIVDRTGAQNRPCCLTFQVPGIGFVNVMMLGASFSNATLIHELTHVWQSQHHFNPMQYMVNATLAMKSALTRNMFDQDPDANTHPEYPTDYPFSAYYLVRGKSFAEYGADQIAVQAERRVASVVGHLRGVAPRVVDADNVASVATGHVCVEDRRQANVF